MMNLLHEFSNKKQTHNAGPLAINDTNRHSKLAVRATCKEECAVGWWLQVTGEGGPLRGLTILQSGSLVQNGDSKRCVSCMTPAVTRGLTLLALVGEDFVLIIGTSLVQNSTALLSRAAEGPGPPLGLGLQTEKLYGM